MNDTMSGPTDRKLKMTDPLKDSTTAFETIFGKNRDP